MPRFDLSHAGRFLVLERFDLVNGRYLGFEDFCVLNAYASAQKYEGSYEQLGKRIKAFVSPGELRPALENYFKTLALSCAVRNGDAHLKNFGVLYESAAEGAVVRLAPSYDIVSTTPYLPKDMLALTLGGSKRWPPFKRLLAFGRQHCDLTERQARDLLAQVAEGVAHAAGEMRAYIREHPAFADMGGRMLKDWEKGLALSLRPDDAPLISLGDATSAR